MKHVALIVALFFAILGLSACGSSGKSAIANTPIKVVQVQQPPTGDQVAKAVHCEGFTNDGPSEAGGVLNSGNCWIKGVKYGLDTFASKADRDAWLAYSTSMGVNPKWETDTSVIYPSTDN